MTSEIEQLTVLGVRPSDSRLEAELWRYVPEDADAIYRSRFAAPSDRRLVLGALANPPVLATLALWLPIRRYRAGCPLSASLVPWLAGGRQRATSPLPATAAVESLATQRAVPIVDLDVDPLDGVLDQGPTWTVAAWATTLLVAGATALAAIDPTPLTVGVALLSLPIAIGFVLAHAGAHVQRRDDAIAAAAFDTARRSGHSHPVVIVRERHVAGVSDRAKDRLVPTEARTVSSELTADASLY